MGNYKERVRTALEGHKVKIYDPEVHPRYNGIGSVEKAIYEIADILGELDERTTPELETILTFEDLQKFDRDVVYIEITEDKLNYKVVYHDRPSSQKEVRQDVK